VSGKAWETLVTSAGPGAYIAEGKIGRVIGTDFAGNQVPNIRVIVRDGIIPDGVLSSTNEFSLLENFLRPRIRTLRFRLSCRRMHVGAGRGLNSADRSP
jgi:hypothetical protein